MYKIGVDLGGTKTEVIVLDENLDILERKRVPTPQNNYDEIISTISNLVLDVSKNISDFTLGICCPGAISKQTGLIKNSNTQCLIGKSLKKDLENKLQKKISIENTILYAPSNLPSLISYDASLLYSKNLFNFINMRMELNA